MTNYYVAPGYDENGLLWDREDGTVVPRVAPRPGEDAITFRESWGIDRHLGLPEGQPAHIVNRYIDALGFAAKDLAAFATCERAGDEFDIDRRHIVYEAGYEPYAMAFNAVTKTVFPDQDGLDEVEWGVESKWRPGNGYRWTQRDQQEMEAEIRRRRGALIRPLIIPGDASYTTAAPGQRYTRIRVDLSTGHLTAHTADEPDADQAQVVWEWQVPQLNAQQANRVMRTVGADALRIARPEDPTVVTPDAWKRIREALEGLTPAEEEVTAALNGVKDTPDQCTRSRRRLVAARVKSLLVDVRPGPYPGRAPARPASHNPERKDVVAEHNDVPETTADLAARYVSLDIAGLRALSPEDRFTACRAISKTTPEPVKHLLTQAAVEVREKYSDAHGGNAAVARRLGVTPAYVGQIINKVREQDEPYKQMRERLDREMVEDYTAHPHSWLRQVQALPDLADMFIVPTVEAAQAGDWETAKAGLHTLIHTMQATLDALEGRTVPELVAEAEQIQAGEAPWQQHTYRRRVSYRDDTGLRVEHSDTAWEADNAQTIQEVAEDSGYLVDSFYERMGEYTPGRKWRIELWRDPQALGEPDQVHEHVEQAPPADQIRIADAIADGRLVRDGKVDTDLLRQFITAGHAEGTDKAGE